MAQVMHQIDEHLRELEDLGIEIRPVAARRRGRVFAVGTHKGGLGKSTTVAHTGRNVAAALAKTHAVESAALRGGYMPEGDAGFLALVKRLGGRRVRGEGDHASVLKRKVLLVDLDSQSNLKGYLNVPVRPGYTLMEVIKGERSAAECIEKVPNCGGHLYLLPSGRNLTELEPLLWGQAKAAKEWVIGRIREALRDGAPISSDQLADWETDAAIREHASMHVLRDLLEPLLEDYEMIILDLPPARSRVTLSGLVAADDVIIVSEANEVSRVAITDFMETIREARDYREEINSFGILVTRYRGRAKDEEQLRDLRQEYGDRVFQTVIQENPRIEDSFGRGVSTSKQTTRRNYGEFAAELLERERVGLPGFFGPLAEREAE